MISKPRFQPDRAENGECPRVGRMSEGKSVAAVPLPL